jgi:hypothetical protein
MDGSLAVKIKITSDTPPYHPQTKFAKNCGWVNLRPNF